MSTDDDPPVASTSALAPIPTPDSQSCSYCHAPSSFIQYDSIQGVTACTNCGTLSQTTSSDNLVVLGRVLEEEGTEAGRNYIRNQRKGYVGMLPAGGGFRTKESEFGGVSMYTTSRINQIERFMRSLLNVFDHISLHRRAVDIFHSIRSKTPFKLGKRARLMAAASCYIATREKDRPVPLKEIADIAEVELSQLVRAHLLIKTELCIITKELDPVVYLERLLVHFSTSTPSHLSPKSLSWLRPISLAKTRTLALSLINMLSTLHILTGRTPEHIACATLLASLEGIARSKAPLQLEINRECAGVLGLGDKIYTVAERYREITSVLEKWRERIPWLEKREMMIKKNKRWNVVGDTEDVVRFWEGVDRDDKVKEEEKARERLPELKELEEGDQDDDGDEGDRFPGLIGENGWRKLKMESPSPSKALALRATSLPPPPLTATADTDYRYQRPVTEKRARTLVSVASGLSNPFIPSPSSSSTPSLGKAKEKEKETYLPHSTQTVTARRQLLAGKKPAEIFDTKGLVRPVEERKGRLAMMLLFKDVDEIADEDLFEEDEWEGCFKNLEEVERERSGERWKEWEEWEARPRRERTNGGRKRKKEKEESPDDPAFPEFGDFEGPKSKVTAGFLKRMKEILGEEEEVGDEEMNLGLEVAMGDVLGVNREREVEKEDTGESPKRMKFQPRRRAKTTKL